MITTLLARGVEALMGTMEFEEWRFWGLAAPETASGEAVNEENALNCPPLAAAVGVLSQSLQILPIDVLRASKSGRNELVSDHPVRELFFRESNPETAAPLWRNTEQTHLGLWGNCYSVIQRTYGGDPFALWQRSPKPQRTKMVRLPERGNTLWYELRNPNGEFEEYIPASEMFHVQYTSLDGLVGKSPVKMLREAIGSNKAAERYAAELFANGATPQGSYNHPGRLSEPAYNRLKTSLMAQRGNRHETLLLEEGVEFKPASFNLQETQMVESRLFLLQEIGRVYRIAPHLMQDLSNGTFSNIVELGRQFVLFTLSYWMSLWTGEINRKLLKPPFFARFNPIAFLQGDPAALSQWYRTMFSIGYYSINEIRHEQGLNPLEEEAADEHFVPLNMTPLSKALEDKPAPAPAFGNPPKPGAIPGGDGETPAEPGGNEGGRPKNGEEKNAAIHAMDELMADTIRRMMAHEHAAALRAAKEPRTFLDSLTEFYQGHVERLRDALRLPLRAFLTAGGTLEPCNTPEDWLTNTINEHVAHQRQVLLAAAECRPAELPARVAEAVKNWGK